MYFSFCVCYLRLQSAFLGGWLTFSAGFYFFLGSVAVTVSQVGGGGGKQDNVAQHIGVGREIDKSFLFFHVKRGMLNFLKSWHGYVRTRLKTILFLIFVVETDIRAPLFSRPIPPFLQDMSTATNILRSEEEEEKGGKGKLRMLPPRRLNSSNGKGKSV